MRNGRITQFDLIQNNKNKRYERLLRLKVQILSKYFTQLDIKNSCITVFIPFYDGEYLRFITQKIYTWSQAFRLIEILNLSTSKEFVLSI